MASSFHRLVPRPLRRMARDTLLSLFRLSRHLDRPSPRAADAARRGINGIWRLVAPGDAPPPTYRRSYWPRKVSAADLAVPWSDRPVVSVIIPTFGQVRYTLHCLASIRANSPAAAIEVIVIDDAFPGPETRCLSAVRGIRLVRNEVNLGFLRTCAAASRIARGEFLLFLNNDTEVLPGWLDAMLETFATRPDAGLVGSKLINADGTLQEAGGIVWRDASAWNHGRGRDPAAAEFNYPRRVDYCSGASLMVRRQVFLDAGGFDERYAPAYYEDTDLAFRLRARGLETWYQPRSEVVHFEGQSHGRDIRQGGKAYQARNHAIFLDTWRAVLTRDHHPHGANVLRARDRAHGRIVALIIDHGVPEPDRDAGSQAIMGVITTLLSTQAVVKLWPINDRCHPRHARALEAMGVEILHGPDRLPPTAWVRANGPAFDLVVVSRPDVAEASLDLIRATCRAPVVYYGHDLHFRRAATQEAADAMRARERAIWRRSDLSLYLSAEEEAEVRRLEPTVNVRAVVPYGLPVPTARPADAAAREPWILFVAGFAHHPNAQGAIWFARTVLPLILDQVPAARMAIVGSHPTAEVLALASPQIAIFPNVTPDALRAWYHRARVAVVPLLTGAGVKLKSVEALWHGLPVVMTRVGAQGLPAVDAVAAVTDDAAAFSRAVCDLLTDDALWRSRSESQSDYAARKFSDSALRRSLLEALALVGVTPGEACLEDLAMA